ncbi:MAG: hypothetical protein R3C27_00090 [Hyphomonadaceae bacterium]
MKKDILGVDIGGVLIDRVADGTDTSFFSDRFLETPAVADGFATLARLRERFGDGMHVVSKCGPNVERKSKLWLAHNRFTEITGISLRQVHFCRKRIEKAPICARLGVTHFVDDRYDVMRHLTMVKHRYLFRPDEGDVQIAAQQPLNGMRIVHEWSEIAAELL